MSQTYSEFVKTTFAYSSSINMGTINHTMDLLHITIGIVGEYIELQNELSEYHELSEYAEKELTAEKELAAEKELGDLCYYIHMAANLCNISLPIIGFMINDGELRAIENFVDAVKKKIFYKLEIDLFVPLIDVWTQISFIAMTEFNKPIEYFIEQNKTKLMKRYPSGSFSSTDAAEKKDTL